MAESDQDPEVVPEPGLPPRNAAERRAAAARERALLEHLRSLPGGKDPDAVHNLPIYDSPPKNPVLNKAGTRSARWRAPGR